MNYLAPTSGTWLKTADPLNKQPGASTRLIHSIRLSITATFNQRQCSHHTVFQAPQADSAQANNKRNRAARLSTLLLAFAGAATHTTSADAQVVGYGGFVGPPNSTAMADYLFNPANSGDPSTVCGRYFNSDTAGPLGALCGMVSQLNGAAPASFYDGLNAANFESFKLDSLLFAQTQNDSVLDRMLALRRAKHTDNKTALDVAINGTSVAGVANEVRGGGASADDSADLLSKRLGFWLRVNSANGDKDATDLTGQLDTNQTGVAFGSDYRLGANNVVGGSLGYRSSKAKFGPGGNQGGMDSKTLALSGYFSSYLYQSLYLDTVVNYGKIDYDTRRNVISAFTPPVALGTARGSTNGKTLSAGASLGYDFAAGGLTITPSVNYFYVDSKTDSFAENDGGSFDLSFGDQHYHSSTARLNLNLAYAINSASGVWLPHLSTDWVKEFATNVDTFDVRFVNDVNPAAAPLPVQLDKLDNQYWRVALGVSAQFRNEVSGYLDYQRMLGFNAVTFSNVTLGLRMQF